jgi:tRNA(Ile)-lysidine synthase
MENRKAKVALVRPLLRWATREETEDYCRSLEIEYRNDSMNEDLSLKRVRIRKILLPLLKEFNPKIVQTLAKTASLLQTESEEENENETRKLKIEDRFLLLKDLRSLSQLSIYRTLRGWLKKERKTLRQLDLKHMEAIERLIFSRKSGKVVELPNGERVFKERGKLYWKKKNIENIE